MDEDMEKLMGFHDHKERKRNHWYRWFKKTGSGKCKGSIKKKKRT